MGNPERMPPGIESRWGPCVLCTGGDKLYTFWSFAPLITWKVKTQNSILLQTWLFSPGRSHGIDEPSPPWVSIMINRIRHKIKFK